MIRMMKWTAALITCALLASCSSLGVYDNHPVESPHYPPGVIAPDSLSAYTIAYCWAPLAAAADPLIGRTVDIVISRGDGTLHSTITTQNLRITPSPFRPPQQGHPENYDLGCFDNDDQDIRYNAGRLQWLPTGDVLTFTAGLSALDSDYRAFRINSDTSFSETDPPLTHYDYGAQFGSPQGTYWSPNGDRMATIVTDQAGDVGMNVWILDIGSKSLHKVTSTAAVENPIASVAWSPNGTRLAIGYGGPDSGVEIAQGPDLGSLIEVSSRNHPDALTKWPHWLVSWLDMLQAIREGVNSVEEFNLELTTGSTPVWIGNSQVIFVASNTERNAALFEVNADGSGLHELLPALPGIAMMPRLSPDGKELAFVRFPGWSDRSRAEICRLDLQSMKLRSLIVMPAAANSRAFFISGMDWTPDGEYLAFSSSFSGKSNIYVITADGSKWTNLTSQLDGDAVSPAWEP